MIYSGDMVNHIRRRLWVAAGALAVYWLAIFILTHVPQNALPKVYGSDKLAHFGAYFGLAVLLAWVIRGKSERPRLRTYFLALAIVAGYGAIDEFLQGFVGRTPELRDWLADIAGATCGLVFHFSAIYVFHRGWPAKSTNNADAAQTSSGE